MTYVYFFLLIGLVKSSHYNTKDINIDFNSKEGIFYTKASTFTVRMVPLYYKSALKLTITSIGHYNEEFEENTEVLYISERQTIVLEA